MSDFDRLGWLCSWLAPCSWLAALGACLLGLLVERQTLLDLGLHTPLPGIILVAASIGLFAQTLLALHVARARIISPEERRTLFRELWLGFGYQRWRSVMRAAHRR
jgi:hypothetical protein